MASSHFDNNHVHTITAVSSADGTTIDNIKINPTTHILQVSDGTTGSDLGPYNSIRDENHVPTLIAVSSSTTTVNGVSFTAGVTPVVLYTDGSGNLLVQST